jgi:hypothetical protein
MSGNNLPKIVEYDPKDVIWGAPSIAKEANMPLRRAYHMLEHGHLPATKVGSLWVSSRRAIRKKVSVE